MAQELTLRSAWPGEADDLSRLALRSKAHWGYSDEFLDACRDELTVRPEHIEAGNILVAVQGGAIVGFYRLDGEPPVGELADLFVEPEAVGSGVGRSLFEHLVITARAAHFEQIRIEADPHAVPFYEARGAIQIGETPSGSIPGRMLPLLELDLPLE